MPERRLRSFVRELIAEVQVKPSSGIVSPRADAFALLGMINWSISGPAGRRFRARHRVRQYTDNFFGGRVSMITARRM